jgi:hypothetical protein
MPYRGVQQDRMYQQTTEIVRQAGFTATWRQYVSASAGVSVAGFGGASSYREQTITAVMGGLMNSVVSPNRQMQTPAGQIAAGDLRIMTNVRMSDKDEVIWRGVRYRVDADAQPSQLNGYWMSILTRGDN